MPEPLHFVMAAAFAAVVSASGVLALAAAGGRRGGTGLATTCVLALGAGLWCGFALLGHRFAWPPMSGLDRLLTLVVPAAVALELTAGLQRVPRKIVWGLRALLLALMPRVLLHDSIYLAPEYARRTGAPVTLILLACGAGLIVGGESLAALSRRSIAVMAPVSLSLATVTAGLCVLLGGYLKGGAAAFPLAGAVAGTAIAARLAAPLAGAAADGLRAVSGAGWVALAGLVIVGCAFGRLSIENAILIGTAPQLAWLAETRVAARRSMWLRYTLACVLVAAPLTYAAARSIREFRRTMAPLLTTLPGAVDPVRPGPPYEFIDVQLRGPFVLWHHRRRFEAAGDAHDRHSPLSNPLGLDRTSGPCALHAARFTADFRLPP